MTNKKLIIHKSLLTIRKIKGFLRVGQNLITCRVTLLLFHQNICLCDAILQIERDAEDNKYSNNPLVSHYINMQEKPAVANLEDPAILNGYLEQLQKDINYEWQAKGIPHFHRKNFASAMKGLPKIDIVSFVFRELKQLKRERA